MYKGSFSEQLPPLPLTLSPVLLFNGPHGRNHLSFSSKMVSNSKTSEQISSSGKDRHYSSSERDDVDTACHMRQKSVDFLKEDEVEQNHRTANFTTKGFIW